MARRKTASAARTTLTARPKKVDGIRLHEVEDGYIFSDAGGERVHHLNSTAVLVIELCTGTNSVTDIVDLVKETYRLPERPEREVLDILAQMTDAGLVALLDGSRRAR